MVRPRWRKIAAEIEASAEGYVLAVSGGVDSMFMLDFFARKCTLPLVVACFNHGLRSQSDDEVDLVRSVAGEHGLPFVTERGDSERMRQAPSLEAEARSQRYSFLEKHLRQGWKIALAHHADDQLETVLMRLMRGAPHHSLRMEKISGNRYRPFLGVTKNTIIEQAERRALRWLHDASNDSTEHERNWVRHELIPLMMTRRNVLKTIALSDHNESCNNIVDNEFESCRLPLTRS